MKYAATKRVLDIAAAGTGLFLALPLGLAVAAALLIENKGDVFFKQSRIGKNGKNFDIYKFNTMTEERDSNGKLLPESERITPVGAVLRKYSMNELPQLMNILKGDMSIVGPRPWTYQCCEYQQVQKSPVLARHMEGRTSIKPGLVCFHGAGISDSAPVTKSGAKKKPHLHEKHDWVRQLATDNFYVKNQSLLMDTCILKKAFIKAVTGREEEILGNNDIYTPQDTLHSQPIKAPASSAKVPNL